jgi:hypothetical protein
MSNSQMDPTVGPVGRLAIKARVTPVSPAGHPERYAH